MRNQDRQVSNTDRINLIVMANVAWPHGMASTRRIRNVVEPLAANPRFSVRVMVLRQGRVRLAHNPPSGTFNGIPYTTIGSGLRPGLSAILGLPGYFREGRQLLRRYIEPAAKNILYVYGGPAADNMPFVKLGRRLGCRVLFDVIEDVDEMGSAADLLARIKLWSQRYYFRRLDRCGDAVLAISRHLQGRAERIVNGRIPVVLFPISVDVSQFAGGGEFHQPVRVLYGGTYEPKDGVENLIDGFDRACEQVDAVLILTGKGSPQRMEAVQRRIAAARHRDRIEYRGYLSEQEHYRTLREADILCMTRVGSGFARGGFPFKLGEYLATGNPVIASRVSDVEEFLTDNVNAVLIEPDSIPAIAEAIVELTRDPVRALGIGRAGLETAAKQFDRNSLARKLRRLVEEL